ncbi:MAG: zinc ribbon domain-containing protein [Terriglobales bacterium]
MPLYEYQCKKCKHRFEKIQKFSDKMVKKCPECGGPIEQMVSAPAVQFKGTGWYVTDYAKKGSSGSASGSASSDGDSTSKDSSNAGKDSKDTTKETKKEEKPKAESSPKKQKKD